jgi:hypothetical protein
MTTNPDKTVTSILFQIKKVVDPAQWNLRGGRGSSVEVPWKSKNSLKKEKMAGTSGSIFCS